MTPKIEAAIQHNIKQANDKLKSRKSIFSLYGLLSTSSNEEIFEHLIKASDLCLTIGDLEKCCQLKEQALSLMTENNYQTYKEYEKLADILSKIDINRSIEVYRKLIDFYILESNYDKICFYCQLLSEIYAKNLEYDKTLEQLDNSLFYSYLSNKESNRRKILQKYINCRLSHFPLDTDVIRECIVKIENYLENSKLYQTLENEILINYFLFLIAYQDYVKIHRSINDHDFRSKTFILNVLKSVEENNSQALSQFSYDYDQIYKLTEVQVKLLFYIKQKINEECEEDLT